MSFFSVPPLSVSKEKDSVLQGGEEKGKREKRERKKRSDSQDKLNIAVRFLVPFLYNLTTTERTGCLSIWA
jgi:hypothetical protein